MRKGFFFENKFYFLSLCDIYRGSLILPSIPMIDVVFAAPILDPNKNYELEEIIRVAVALVVLVSGILSILFVIWGAVMLILSGGKDEKIKPAVNSIRYAVIGIILVVVSLFAAPKLGDLLGLNVASYLSPKTIFATIQELSNKIFGSKSSVDISSDTSTSIGDDFTELK